MVCCLHVWMLSSTSSGLYIQNLHFNELNHETRLEILDYITSTHSSLMYKNITVLFPIYYREHPKVVDDLLHTCVNM